MINLYQSLFIQLSSSLSQMGQTRGNQMQIWKYKKIVGTNKVGEKLQIGSQKLRKFNIHRHYSCPSICKTSKKLKFHKIAFQWSSDVLQDAISRTETTGYLSSWVNSRNLSFAQNPFIHFRFDYNYQMYLSE